MYFIFNSFLSARCSFLQMLAQFQNVINYGDKDVKVSNDNKSRELTQSHGKVLPKKMLIM